MPFYLLLAWLGASAAAPPTPADAPAQQASLTEPSPEEVPRLLAMVAEQREGWIWADAVLGRSRDPRIVPFYIDLLERNFYEKEADGTRKSYGLGSKHGCVALPFVYGGVLARRLGQAGDSRAIPVLREAVKQGAGEVITSAYRSLYDLGALKLDDLFELARSGAGPDLAEIIVGIGWEGIHGDARFALGVFDRVIAELPQHTYQVASAHYWRIQCLEHLGRYADALQEIDEVLRFPQFDNLTEQMRERRSQLEAKQQPARR